jgi:hypothetical protein
VGTLFLTAMAYNFAPKIFYFRGDRVREGRRGRGIENMREKMG